MIGHIIKIKGFTGLWLIIARNGCGYISALAIEPELGHEDHFILYGIAPEDVTARADSYTVKINNFIFDDNRGNNGNNHN